MASSVTGSNLNAWVNAFQKAVLQAYKMIGSQRIRNIENEIYNMERKCVLKTDADIDAYNIRVERLMNQISRINACFSACDEKSGGRGICALFHGHYVSTDGLITLLNNANNYPINLYYEMSVGGEFKLNAKKEGFDIIYDNCLLNNQLFSTIENEHIKNELACMRAMIIVEFVKNNM
uniref:Uncharacterized protein n=1 Tax=viral metagenome TaxID=1070528 RepID=A0A6C0I1W2_9ZZZZ